MASSNWLGQLFPLKRPEYAKQTESLLTDLIWRSPGSSLAQPGRGEAVSIAGAINSAEDTDGLPLNRLVPERTRGGAKKITETYPLARECDLSVLLDDTPEGLTATQPLESLLSSLTAPSSGDVRAVSCVPVEPDAVVFQTLHGLVNKNNPANNADIIETVGALGGSAGKGEVARSFLQSIEQREDSSNTLRDLLSYVAETVWARLGSRAAGLAESDWPVWRRPSPHEAQEKDYYPGWALVAKTRTPFSWFWQKWGTLCDPVAGWNSELPARRFVDWALCILRTGLSFAFLWEAEFYLAIHRVLQAKAESDPDQESERELERLLGRGAILASIEPRSISASQKDVWPNLRENLARGYLARNRVLDCASMLAGQPAGDSLYELIANFVDAVPSDLAHDKCGNPLEPDRRTAKNQKEFVRYLLQPRSGEEAASDQADLYYLFQNDTRSTWIEPGPEWMVVVASLCCGRPGGETTLGTVQKDLRDLGLRAERGVVIRLLEDAGLTSDSPDADEALIVSAGF